MRFLRLGMGFLLVMVGGAQAVAADEHPQVHATGQSSIVDDDQDRALQNAILDAKRNAAENAGARAVAETFVQELEIVRTGFASRWSSYVEAFTVVTEQHTEDGRLEVEILATIDDRRMRADAERFYGELPKPSVLVLVEIDGDESLSLRARKALQEFLAHKGCAIVDIDDDDGYETVRRRLREGDLKFASSLGRQSGADVVMLATGDVGRTESVRELLFRSESELRLRTLRADNGELLAEVEVAAKAIEGMRSAAPAKAIRVAARRASHEVFASFLVEWNRQLTEGWVTRAIFADVLDSEMVDDIARNLRALQALRHVEVEDYTDSVVTLGLQYMGDSHRLAEYLRHHFQEGRVPVRIETIAPGEIFGYVDAQAEEENRHEPAEPGSGVSVSETAGSLGVTSEENGSQFPVHELP